MTDDASNPIATLTTDECWERLGEQRLGRLVTHIGGTFDIFPVNFVVQDQTILFRTAPGSKLFELTVNDDVLFEADDYTSTSAWSVIARGYAQVLDTTAEIAKAEQAELKTWVDTDKPYFVRVFPTSLSGRAFVIDA